MNITRKQENILHNYLKTLGYEYSGDHFSYFDAKEKALSEIERYKNKIIEAKTFKESDKNYMIAGDNYIRKTKSNPNSTKKEIKGAADNAKNRQRLYKETLKYYKDLKELLRNKESEYNSLILQEKEIAKVKIDFGPYVRNTTGEKCTVCGCLDAYSQINPYVAEIEQRTEFITVCDDCASLIAEEI